MNPVIELERLVYFFKNKEDRDENKLFLVQEKKEGKVCWIPLTKGWDYQLWYHIGERGGLAEAEELFLHENGEAKKVTIEEYVKSCRETLNKAIPAETIFNRFDIQVTASRKKDLKRDYIIQTIEKEYGLEKVKEDEERIYYEKTITTSEELEKITINWIDKEHEVYMSITEKQ
ncbi:hypothetical protein CVD28_03370 [Bacillus sp. M6-12]|uniref:hypothetical protein n=1 Tax=Bacillus sp. M6-12 TaxID=2054166 RepID=UPI000C76F191|nr:hypothetical protein [Bacillus sp. M6-12]PLS19469.1 hypothetical protein CVD28_03370 [Bacillus sp. M6-12]